MLAEADERPVLILEFHAGIFDAHFDLARLGDTALALSFPRSACYTLRRLEIRGVIRQISCDVVGRPGMCPGIHRTHHVIVPCFDRLLWWTCRFRSICCCC